MLRVQLCASSLHSRWLHNLLREPSARHLIGRQLRVAAHKQLGFGQSTILRLSCWGDSEYHFSRSFGLKGAEKWSLHNLCGKPRGQDMLLIGPSSLCCQSGEYRVSWQAGAECVRANRDAQLTELSNRKHCNVIGLGLDQ